MTTSETQLARALCVLLLGFAAACNPRDAGASEAWLADYGGNTYGGDAYGGDPPREHHPCPTLADFQVEAERGAITSQAWNGIRAWPSVEWSGLRARDARLAAETFATQALQRHIDRFDNIQCDAETTFNPAYVYVLQGMRNIENQCGGAYVYVSSLLACDNGALTNVTVGGVTASSRCSQSHTAGTEIYPMSCSVTVSRTCRCTRLDPPPAGGA